MFQNIKVLQKKLILKQSYNFKNNYSYKKYIIVQIILVWKFKVNRKNKKLKKKEIGKRKSVVYKSE